MEPLGVADMALLNEAKQRLAQIHPGGYHYVGCMSWGASRKSRRFYAIATSGHYYVSSDTIEGLAQAVEANIPRGTPGNSFQDDLPGSRPLTAGDL